MKYSRASAKLAVAAARSYMSGWHEVPPHEHSNGWHAPGAGRTIVSDTEGNNLWPAVDRLHCAVAIDVATGEVFEWRPWEIQDYERFLSECEEVIGHNFLDYDIRAIEKVLGLKKRPRVRDSLLMARILFPGDVLFGPDFMAYKKGQMPGRYMKMHSLAAWGYRLGEHKEEFHPDNWDVWSEEMQHYMVQDGISNLVLWFKLVGALGWFEDVQSDIVWPEWVVEYEHRVAAICLDEEEHGFYFNKEEAAKLAGTLQDAAEEIAVQLREVFPEWWRHGNVIYPKTPRNVRRPDLKDVRLPRFSEKTGKPLKDYVGPPIMEYHPDAPYVQITRTEFNAGSRADLGDRLQAVYGWKPKVYGGRNKDKPQVDEGTLKEIPESILPQDVRQLILDFFAITKALGQLAQGKKSWLNLVALDHRIHGRVNTASAITRRATHSDPNKGQVPAVVEGKDAEGNKIKVTGVRGKFGVECRSLWCVPEGMELTGTDESSLELILLGHYLAPFDDGAWSSRVCDPERDAHTEHSEITGLSRHSTKTVTYAYIYGGGAERIGQELEIEGDQELIDLLNYKGLPSLLAYKKRRDGDAYLPPDDIGKAKLAKGRIVITAFERRITGIKDLKDKVSEVGGARGWLKAIDGSKVYVRKKHAALNTLLQSAGAIVCKLWMVKFHDMMAERGHPHKKDWWQVAWVHDELQIEHEAGLGPLISEVSNLAAKAVGVDLGLRGEFRTDSHTGRNWAETH